jgi:hypothetical protein
MRREDRDRGTGRTTKQMQAAAKGAHFVWSNDILSYPRDLVKKLGRNDLQIVGPSFLFNHGFRGRVLTGLVIDHACQFTDHWPIGEALAQVRSRKKHCRAENSWTCEAPFCDECPWKRPATDESKTEPDQPAPYTCKHGCERDEIIDKLNEVEKALRIAAGLISTMPEHSKRHPEEVLEWIRAVAHKDTMAHQIEMAAARHVLNNVIIPDDTVPEQAVPSPQNEGSN